MIVKTIGFSPQAAGSIFVHLIPCILILDYAAMLLGVLCSRIQGIDSTHLRRTSPRFQKAFQNLVEIHKKVKDFD